MINFGAKILNNALSSLSAQQAVIATTGNNIANVNTPGYTRRVVDLENRTSSGAVVGLDVGNGVEASRVRRISDYYLEGLLHSSISDKEEYSIQSDILSRADALFSLDGSAQTIGSTLTSFFTAANDLTLDPSSVELRATFIERVADLTNSINNTYNSLAALQREADSRLVTEVQDVNGIIKQIADLNSQIATRESGSLDAADERDRRDILMNHLAEKIGYSSVEASDGSVTISLSSGFALVAGSNYRELSISNKPSFVSSAPMGLDGASLNYITYNYGTNGSAADIDLTQDIMNEGGSIGGLLTIRGFNDPENTSPFQASGILVDFAKRVEAISRTLLTSVNEMYLGADESTDANHQPSSADLDGIPPETYGLFSFDVPSTVTRDANNNGLPDDLVALDFPSYAALIRPTFTNPRRVAAALDTDSTINSTVFAKGDGRNIQAIANMQEIPQTFVVNGVSGVTPWTAFNLTATFDEAYNELVTNVSGSVGRAISNASLSSDYYTTIANRRDEVSAVSLDEEFSNLIKYQKAYTASAKMVKVADQLTQEILNLL